MILLTDLQILILTLYLVNKCRPTYILVPKLKHQKL